MSNIVAVVRFVVLSTLLAFVGAFAALATGTGAAAVETASQTVIDQAVIPFNTVIQDASYRWEVVEERVKMGDTNLVDGVISEIMVHEANIRGTIEYEAFWQVCNLADRLHYLSQDLYVKQFALMGWFGF